MRFRSLAKASALAMASSSLLAGSAVSADSTVGQTFTPTLGCSFGAPQPVTFLQSASAMPSYTAASKGVITSWRSSAATGDSTRAIKVVRTAAGVSTVVGTAAPVTAAAGQAFTQNVRIPAQAGDYIGFSTIGNTTCATTTSQADTIQVVFSDPAQGSTFTAGQTSSGYRIDIAAVLEPDADGDGFGDTTQDQCPTDATTQGACKVVTSTPPTTAPLPDITFGRHTDGRIKTPKPGKKAKKTAKVTVVFAGNSSTVAYRCSVDGAAYVPCTSPFKPKLKKGKHTVTIQAIDAAGRVDPTPPTTPVKVTKAKKRK